MIAYYDKTGLYVEKPENIREIFYIKYSDIAFYIDMKDYQTGADRLKMDHYDKLARMIKSTLKEKGSL